MILINHKKTISKVDTGNNLLNLQKPNWHNYVKLENAFIDLRRNWCDFGNKRQADNDLEPNEFVQNEFDQQIIKIENIFSAEENLKLAGLDRAFREYAKKRRQTLDDFFKKKSINVNENLKLELRQKEIEIDHQIQSYQYELENDYRLSLVNLQLQLALADLKSDSQGNTAKKDTVQAKITAIKQEIVQKLLLKKESLKKQLLSYEKQRRDETSKVIADLKISLETELENDLADYQAKLVLNYNDWRQNQALKYAKAIEVRREQKNK